MKINWIFISWNYVILFYFPIFPRNFSAHKLLGTILITYYIFPLKQQFLQNLLIFWSLLFIFHLLFYFFNFPLQGKKKPWWNFDKDSHLNSFLQFFDYLFFSDLNRFQQLSMILFLNVLMLFFLKNSNYFACLFPRSLGLIANELSLFCHKGCLKAWTISRADGTKGEKNYRLLYSKHTSFFID